MIWSSYQDVSIIASALVCEIQNQVFKLQKHQIAAREFHAKNHFPKLEMQVIKAWLHWGYKSLTELKRIITQYCFIAYM